MLGEDDVVRVGRGDPAYYIVKRCRLERLHGQRAKVPFVGWGVHYYYGGLYQFTVLKGLRVLLQEDLEKLFRGDRSPLERLFGKGTTTGEEGAGGKAGQGDNSSGAVPGEGHARGQDEP